MTQAAATATAALLAPLPPPSGQLSATSALAQSARSLVPYKEVTASEAAHLLLGRVEMSLLFLFARPRWETSSRRCPSGIAWRTSG